MSITAVKISPDLSLAQVYVDVLPGQAGRARLLEGLNAGASAIRSKLGKLIRLKRTPALRFVFDGSIEQGNRIEAVLAELREQEGAGTPDEPSTPDEPESAPESVPDGQ